MWGRIRRVTAASYEPQFFVTLLGYEWTSRAHGHRHALCFEDRGDVSSSIDPAYDTPTGLRHVLASRPATTIAHHTAGGPVAANWQYRLDSNFETIAEIVSVHGTSAVIDAPRPIHCAVPRNLPRDVLDRAYRLAFVGSRDSHEGHPGLVRIGSATRGATAIVSEDLSRESVRDALARRHCATNGPRIIIELEVDGQPMGGGAQINADATAHLVIVAHGPSTIDRIDIIPSVSKVASHPGDGGRGISLTYRLDNLAAGELVYARVPQDYRVLAWSSPVFFE